MNNNAFLVLRIVCATVGGYETVLSSAVNNSTEVAGTGKALGLFESGELELFGIVAGGVNVNGDSCITVSNLGKGYVENDCISGFSRNCGNSCRNGLFSRSNNCKASDHCYAQNDCEKLFHFESFLFFIN